MHPTVFVNEINILFGMIKKEYYELSELRNFTVEELNNKTTILKDYMENYNLALFGQATISTSELDIIWQELNDFPMVCNTLSEKIVHALKKELINNIKKK